MKRLVSIGLVLVALSVAFAQDGSKKKKEMAAGADEQALSKIEEALLDLAQAGFTVQRSLEVIPEPDSEVFGAMRSLIDAGMLELR